MSHVHVRPDTPAEAAVAQLVRDARGGNLRDASAEARAGAAEAISFLFEIDPVEVKRIVNSDEQSSETARAMVAKYKVRSS